MDTDGLDYSSTLLGVVDAVKGALTDLLNGHDLGTAPTGAAGVLSSGLGITSALDQYANSEQTAEDYEDLAFNLATNLPGLLGVAATGIDEVRDAIGSVFDRGENEAKLLKGLLEFSKWLDEMIRTKPDTNGIPDILESARDKFGAGKRQASPIILDLDGDGVETTKVNTGTYFDHDGNGLAESTGWVGADDGLLVRDVDGSGWIDTGAELFGNHTRLANGQMAANGFEALRDLDSIANGGNADGKLDASDAAFASLKVWEDADGDGYHSAGEVISLDEAGVHSINVGYTTSTATDTHGNAHSQIGSYTKADGSTATATDVWFQTDKMNTLADDWLEVPDDIAAMPDIRGFGNVHSLQQAMVRDGSGKDPGRKAANGREWRAAA